MEELNFKLRGEARAVFNYLNILATTSEKDYHSNPAWWSLRAKLLGLDMGRDPQHGLENRLVDRRN